MDRTLRRVRSFLLNGPESCGRRNHSGPRDGLSEIGNSIGRFCCPRECGRSQFRSPAPPDVVGREPAAQAPRLKIGVKPLGEAPVLGGITA